MPCWILLEVLAEELEGFWNRGEGGFLARWVQKGCLRYKTARDAAEYARWDARDRGGKIDVFDQQERLFRSIVIEPAELADSGFVLPSV